MKKIKWRKWNRATHRDLGYFFFFMTIIYGISGVAINHIGDWNPNYEVTHKEINLGHPIIEQPSKQEVLDLLDQYGEKENYKKHYYPDPLLLKVFLNGGSALVDLETGRGQIEKLRRRPIFHAVNYLHYNPTRWWTWFSDAYAVAMVILAITGLFILRGKNGITRRGAWITALGIIIPVIFLMIYH
nr:PepSY-associated TM helix domain-containing protein [Bacteroidota bacterium]